MVMYQKDRHALDSFEERYIGALRARMELALFLHAEMNVVEELIKTEGERRRKDAERIETAKKSQARRQSIAERVMEENRRRIANYPRIEIHPDASEEIERLFGALGAIEREFWPDLERLIRRTYTSAMISPRARLEEQLMRLCSSSSGELPSRTSRYRSMFDRFPRNYTEIDKEEKKCILDAAFFLHDLSDTIKEAGESDVLSANDRQQVDAMAEYVHNVITDFRLKDFKHLQR